MKILELLLSSEPLYFRAKAVAGHDFLLCLTEGKGGLQVFPVILHKHFLLA